MDGQKKKQTVLLVASLLGVLILCLLFGGISGSTKKDDSHSFAVYFTEVLASNSKYPDILGHHHDFIELYNSADGDIDISGFKLTDSQRNVGYEIPSGTILKAGEYLVIWCESNTNEDLADFSISKNGGEVIYLMNRKNVIVDTVNTLPSKRNMPMILTSDGTWTLSSFATPGYPNTQEGYNAYLQSRHASSFPVQISEVLSSNHMYPSPDGICYDYIELHNLSNETIDLSGCTISDTPDKVKYYFPSTTIKPDGYLILWCDENTGLPFRLSSVGGEQILLQSPGGDIIDEVMLPALNADQSYARNAEGDFVPTYQVTPGYSNDDEGYASYVENSDAQISVVISEVMAENKSVRMGSSSLFPDWIELYNAGNDTVDLNGWYLSDDESDLTKWPFPSTTLDSDSFLLVYCDGENMVDVDGGIHTSFSLSRFGETLCLTSSSGVMVDKIVLPEAVPDCSSVPVGSNQAANTEMLTPGFPNTFDGYYRYQASLIAPDDLMISEVMTANDLYLEQPNNKFYDWVELYNNTSSTLDLSDYYLTDSLNDLYRYPLNGSINAGDYYTVVLADGKLGLNAQEDWLYLVNSDGSIIDVLHLKNIPYRCSFGRSLSEGGHFYFETPTPGKPNEEGRSLISSTPTADTAPGIYDNVNSLTVALSGNGTIYYTLDGSWPTAKDEVYTVPFELTESTVIRAVCMEDGYLPSDTITLGYLINEKHTLPVVSLTCDPSDLTGNFGIITNILEDWEKHANLSFYDLDGSSFSMDCGVSLFGSLSRATNMKKSFKCTFRSRYGNASLDYPLYDDRYENQFHSLVLRNSQDYLFSFIREEVMTSLVQDCSDALQTARSRYVILYLNGEYYGIYALKEAFSTSYYAAHYQVPEDTCTCVRVINVTRDAPELFDLMRYCNTHDLSDPDAYEYVTSMVDTDSVIDWMIFEAYCANGDILNNVRYLHSTVDGKWRWAYYDLDWSMYTHAGFELPLDPDEQFSLIPRGLLRNPEFKEQLLSRLSELLMTTLSNENVTDRMDELASVIRPEMGRERTLWGSSVSAWEQNLNIIKNYVIQYDRAKEMVYSLNRYVPMTKEELQYYFGGILDE